MDDLKNFFCWNKKCPKYGIRGAENIFIRAWYGKNKDIRLLCCRDCGGKFSERRGTIFLTPVCPKRKPFPLWSTLPKELVFAKQGCPRRAKNAAPSG